MFFPVQSCSYKFLSCCVSPGVGLGSRVLRGCFFGVEFGAVWFVCFVCCAVHEYGVAGDAGLS